MLFRSSDMRPRANTLSPTPKSVGAILMNLSFVFSPGGMRMNDGAVAERDRDLAAGGGRDDYLACVWFEFGDDPHHAQGGDGGIG